MSKRVIAGSDHAGLALRAEAVKVAREAGFEVEDLGPFSGESVDYPDYAKRVAEEVAAGRAEVGVLVCGTGIGMSISANKVHGIRAGLCHTEFEARMTRQHNNANVLCLGARVTGVGLAIEILKVFLATPFEGGRHQARLDKVTALEAQR